MSLKMRNKIREHFQSLGQQQLVNSENKIASYLDVFVGCGLNGSSGEK